MYEARNLDRNPEHAVFSEKEPVFRFPNRTEERSISICALAFLKANYFAESSCFISWFCSQTPTRTVNSEFLSLLGPSFIWFLGIENSSEMVSSKILSRFEYNQSRSKSEKGNCIEIPCQCAFLTFLLFITIEILGISGLPVWASRFPEEMIAWNSRKEINPEKTTCDDIPKLRDNSFLGWR